MCFFQRFVAQEGRQAGSLKRRVRSHVVKGEMNNCTPLWREAHCQVKMNKTQHLRTTFEVDMYKTNHVRTTFGSYDVEKLHAAVTRSTCTSEHVQNTYILEHFSTFGCQKGVG